MNLNYLVEYAKRVIGEHPLLRMQIIDIVTLAKDEIEDGGSEDHEVNLAINDIEALIG